MEDLKTSVLKKIDESTFFLEKVFSGNENEFEFYLSAYLNATISVRSLLRHHRDSERCSQHFKKWYDFFCEQKENCNLFEFMRKLRNINHHERQFMKSRFISLPFVKHLDDLSEEEGLAISLDLSQMKVIVGPTKNYSAEVYNLESHDELITVEGCKQLDHLLFVEGIGRQPLSERLKEYQKKLEKIVCSFAEL